ncbi:colicin immunity protein [Trinickia sp. YCB016]
MNIDHQRRYESPDDFFVLGGSVVMKVSADALIAICVAAAEHGLVVAGGIWHNPGFEARLDCIWDGVDSPVDRRTTEQNNCVAADFVRSERKLRDAFVNTAPPMAGWCSSYKPRKQ